MYFDKYNFILFVHCCFWCNMIQLQSSVTRYLLLPLETESRGVVVEVSPYELGQPFKKPVASSVVVDVNRRDSFARDVVVITLLKS